MAFNLLESVKGLFTTDLVSQAASSLGENETGIRKALNAAIPTSLVGVLDKAGSGGAMDLLDISRQASRSGVLGNIKGLLGGTAFGNIMNMVSGLFGDKLGGVVKTIANFAGIKESSAASVMNLAAPAALATIGREASSTNMTTSGLVSMLNSQKDSIIGAVPSGLNIAGALGLGSLGEIGNKISGAVSGLFGTAKTTANYARDTVVEETKKKTNWVLPLVLFALLALGLWYLLGRKKTPDTVMSTVPDTTAIATTPVVTTPTVEVYKVRLPDGSELDALRGGIEERLVAFLGTNWKGLGVDSLKKIWFDFDDLNFETGSAQITAASQRQVNNIAAIMKQYPNVKFKIGGYTDKVGDAGANKKLSQERADAVSAALKTAGAASSSIAGAEGYGEEFATVDENASDEARRVDRRISLSVRQ